jgi:hypothetical protein
VRALIAFLLCLFLMPSLTYGAQKDVTVPQGTTVYGPFAWNVLHRRGELSFVRTGMTATGATFTFGYSPDGGTTWLGETSPFFCRVVMTAQVNPTNLYSADCPLPIGAIATHLRVTAVVVGGTITISSAPTVRSK